MLVNEGLRFPRRNGVTTRYLSEPEVATAYRERFADAHRQDDRARQIEQEALGRLADDADRCRIVVSLVPDLPGELFIDEATVRGVRGELVGAHPMIMHTSLSWTRVAVGRRCLLVSDPMGNSLAAKWLSAELHHDGAGVFAVNASDAARNARMGGLATQGERWLHDEHAVNGILTGLRFLSRHARDRAAAGGDALVHAQVHPVNRGTVYLSSGGRGMSDLFSEQSPPAPAHPAEAVAPLDSLAIDGPDLVAAAYLLASELFQTFGRSEAAQLTRDGQLRLPYWGREWQSDVQAWATGAGITVTSATLPA